MISVTSSCQFCAAHSLENLPEGHKCGRIHGHNYTVEFSVYAEECPKSGMLIDFHVLKGGLETITGELDHRMLNDHPLLGGQATAERLSEYIGREVCLYLRTTGEFPSHIDYISCSVWETDKNFATFGADIEDIFVIEETI